MSRPHLLAWLLAIGAGLLALHFHDQRVRADERARVTADSLTRAHATLDSAISASQESVTVQRRREAQVLAQVGVREAAVRRATGQAGALAAALRDSLGGAQRAQFDSLEAAHATTDSLLEAQRDSYRALFLAAAAQRDTLAGLLRASQAQLAGLQAALVQARWTPLWDRTPIRVVELGLALYGAAKLGGR